jgi:hypothetical protein
MVPAILITGDTFTSRRDLKALGGKWYPPETGWIIPFAKAEEAEKLASGRNFIASIIEVEPEALERPRGERLRAIRQEKLDRRAARNLAKAERLERLSDQEAAKIKPYDDFAFWTQPILIGHHSEKAHRRLRDRLDTAMSKSAAYDREAKELRAASTPATARIAGDAERKRQAERDALDKINKIGSRVLDVAFGPGTVVRVHKKSYTVKFDGGFQHARDKTHVRPLGRHDPLIPAEPPPSHPGSDDRVPIPSVVACAHPCAPPRSTVAGFLVD